MNSSPRARAAIVAAAISVSALALVPGATGLGPSTIVSMDASGVVTYADTQDADNNYVTVIDDATDVFVISDGAQAAAGTNCAVVAGGIACGNGHGGGVAQTPTALVVNL